MIYWELFYVFFTVGLFTFGGGHAMIPLLQQQVVAHGWASESTVVDFIAVSESTPGTFAINMATFVGHKMGGAFGTIAAVGGMVLPSFIVIIIVAKFFTNFRDNKYVKSVMSLLHAVVLGLISYAVLTVTITATVSYDSGTAVVDLWAVGLICVLFGITKIFKKIHPILLIVISAILGMLLYGVIL